MHCCCSESTVEHFSLLCLHRKKCVQAMHLLIAMRQFWTPHSMRNSICRTLPVPTYQHSIAKFGRKITIFFKLNRDMPPAILFQLAKNSPLTPKYKPDCHSEIQLSAANTSVHLIGKRREETHAFRLLRKTAEACAEAINVEAIYFIRICDIALRFLNAT